MRILIAGAGIAGLSLAYWLRRGGHEPVLVEKAPALGTRGFLIGIRGGSITVLRKMGVLDTAMARAMDTIHYHVLDAKGRRINGGRYLSYREDERGKLPLNRADLQAVLYEAVKDDVGVHFGTTLTALRPGADGVEVDLSGSAASGHFDLVIGADGVHSWVRQAIFGAAGPTPLPAAYVAFIAQAPADGPGRGESYLQFGLGRMSVLYDLGAGKVGGLFILRALPAVPGPMRQHLADLHRESAPQIAAVLDALPDPLTLFADRLISVRLPAWSRGRVGLVGDAAYSLSPASGFGATAALAGSYHLAQALMAEGPAGQATYERRMRPSIESRQRTTANVTAQLITRNPAVMFIRETALRLMREDGVYKARRAETFGIED
jgi:2-polyprenyl-6-methoxyphenol hydroxylase-like FAD-dependent oxidoreductase